MNKTKQNEHQTVLDFYSGDISIKSCYFIRYSEQL